MGGGWVYHLEKENKREREEEEESPLFHLPLTPPHCLNKLNNQKQMGKY